jgi:hypothetical protein
MENSLPGTGLTTMMITLDEKDFADINILRPSAFIKTEVVKVYKKTLWRKFLLMLGFRVKWLKLKIINDENKRGVSTGT